jgi:peptide chain release factor 1
MRQRCVELELLLSDPTVIGQQTRYLELLREHGQLRDPVTRYNELRAVDRELSEARDMLAGEQDAELQELAGQEIERLERRREEILDILQTRLLSADEDDHRDVILEIRAGTGGDEACLFAEDLFRMYSRYAERCGFRLEILEASHNEGGGYRELICKVGGAGAFGLFKYEGGGHRIQRVPKTEAQGRIHTSLCTVAVLPEVEEVEIEIRREDYTVDVFRSSGPGGQSVNTTDSAVRITHLATGLVVTCQDEKSQHKNKDKALRVLRARLYERERAQRHAEQAANRKQQVGTGDRSGKIRTYNVPQNRVTDHRIGLSINNLEVIMLGELEPLVDALRRNEVEERVRALGASA